MLQKLCSLARLGHKRQASEKRCDEAKSKMQVELSNALRPEGKGGGLCSAEVVDRGSCSELEVLSSRSRTIESVWKERKVDEALSASLVLGRGL